MSPRNKNDFDSRAAPPGGSSESVRLSINLGPRDVEKLAAYRQRTGATATDTIRRALTVLTFISDAKDRKEEIHTMLPNGDLKAVIFDV
jgi:hypothetical protein